MRKLHVITVLAAFAVLLPAAAYAGGGGSSGGTGGAPSDPADCGGCTGWNGVGAGSVTATGYDGSGQLTGVTDTGQSVSWSGTQGWGSAERSGGGSGGGNFNNGFGGGWINGNTSGGDAWYPSNGSTPFSYPSCTLTITPWVIPAGGSATLSWRSSDQAMFHVQHEGSPGIVSMTISPGIGSVTPWGNTSRTISPSQTTTYTASVRDSNGVYGSCTAMLVVAGTGNTGTSSSGSGNGSGSGGSVTPTVPTCTPLRICSSDKRRIINSCDSSDTYQTCTSYQYCDNATCKTYPVSFVSFTATVANGTTFPATGHLEATPKLVKQGTPTRLYWNVSHAKSCTLTRSDAGVLSTAFSSGANGLSAPNITGQTIFTLHCLAYPGITPDHIDESVVVNVVPTYQEQ